MPLAYGTTVAPPPAHNEEDTACELCMEEGTVRDTVCVPCGHTYMCGACARECLGKGFITCATCQKPLTALMFMADGSHVMVQQP